MQSAIASVLYNEIVEIWSMHHGTEEVKVKLHDAYAAFVRNAFYNNDL